MHVNLVLIIKVIRAIYIVAWVGFGIYMAENQTFPINQSETAAAIYVAVTILSAPLGLLVFVPGTNLIGNTLNAWTSDLNVLGAIILFLGFVVGFFQWFFFAPWIIRRFNKKKEDDAQALR